MEENTKQINFFKKIYYSIFKIKEYGKLGKLGLKKSIQYIMDLLLLVSLIYAVLFTVKLKKSMNSFKDYLTINLPDFKIVENELYIEQEDRIVLNNDIIVANFGGQIVIDEIKNYDDLVEEYRNLEEPTILLTKNRFTTINKVGDVNEEEYNNVINRYLGNNVNAVDKEELLYLFDKVSYTYYFFGYLLSYVIAHSILVFIYAFIISIIMYIFCKIKKIKVELSEIYCFSLYALTITVIAYLAINFLPILMLRVIQISFAIVPIINLSAAIYINKWLMPDMSKK